jgi:hypothetical protein
MNVILPRIVRLRTVLDQAADALVSADLEALLASEAEIEDALANMPVLTTMTADERAEIRGELERARGALLRCRRLGTTLTAFVRVSFDAQGRHGGYGEPGWSSAGGAIDARV